MTEDSTERAVPEAMTLGYDDYVPTKDRRSRTLFLGFWLGSFCVPTVVGVLLTLFLMRGEELFGALVEGFIASVGFSMLAILPTTLALGITIWIRLKLLREVRFAGFRAAFLTGVFGGLYPFLPFRILPISERAQVIVFFGGLAWHVLFPIAAGFWLCYRSALRDS